MATAMLAAGVPVPVVSERLRHARNSTTVNIYAHAMPGADHDAANLLAGPSSTEAIWAADTTPQTVSEAVDPGQGQPLAGRRQCAGWRCPSRCTAVGTARWRLPLERRLDESGLVFWCAVRGHDTARGPDGQVFSD